jgi:hypothetical protein
MLLQSCGGRDAERGGLHTTRTITPGRRRCTPRRAAPRTPTTPYTLEDYAEDDEDEAPVVVVEAAPVAGAASRGTALHHRHRGNGGSGALSQSQ